MTAEPQAPGSVCTLGERHDWIAAVADHPIDPTIFDKRSLTGLRRQRIETWGDLGRLDDAALLNIAYVGTLTVSRIHEALTSHGLKMRDNAAALAARHKTAFEREQAAPADFDLVTAAAWTSVATDDLTVAGLVTACLSDNGIPEEVGEATRRLLSVSLSQLVGSEVAPLAERISDLIVEASGPELAAREFVRFSPDLARTRQATRREWRSGAQAGRQRRPANTWQARAGPFPGGSTGRETTARRFRFRR